MILQALVDYYETLARQGSIAKPGWGAYKISYAINLNQQGEVIGILSLEKEVMRGKKRVSVPAIHMLPEGVKKSSGIRPQFLWANAAYCLGLPKENKTADMTEDAATKWEKDKKRSIACFEAMKQYHLDILEAVHTPSAEALKRFFTTWKPETAENHPVLKPYLTTNLLTANVMYAVEGVFVQDDETIRAAWDAHYNQPSDDAIKGQCLVTGEMAPIARIHPNIKGVRGAQSSGASLVSFNAEAFESYGHSGGQCYNAPVSEHAAFAYTTALNQLIADEKHCKIIGNTTVVYWAANGEEAYQDLLYSAVFEDDDTIDDETLDALFSHIQKGMPFDFQGVPIHPDTPFYILGLSPNAARLSVRFFLQDTFGHFIDHVRKHYERLEIVMPQQHRAYLPLWRLLGETVNPKRKDAKGKLNKKYEKASPLLAGAVMRSILSDTPYPQALYNSVMLRVKADQDDKDEHIYKITAEKAAIIKACLLKNFPKGETITVALNEESTNTAYVLGRLFSVLEQIQEKAHEKDNGRSKVSDSEKNRKGINSTIKDRFFNSAAATPGWVFPILLKMANHHLRKLNDRKGLKIELEKMVTELEGKIEMNGQPIPARMNLTDQGLFILGYYHQTQKRYAKKEEK
ncbi:type I-C CRISPR-associated protein Cas8c/Csd1 [uncultured Megasphaera sp.]|uniref:type I-C CRISPR-associated protein Cas8c/Csd1 n=1 Tax=uncultured Megasphaera sp. TaxID=165188 RepID=UPI0025E21FFD|nr:type I-C CRISPR-associated protein Cas8c/Csd1 [uncultured Megasphaera sp.]